MSISDLQLSALLANVETRGQCRRLYDIFDSFPLVDNGEENIDLDDDNFVRPRKKELDNSREKMYYTFTKDLVLSVELDGGRYKCEICMPEISCFDFVRNFTVDVLSKHNLEFEMPTDINCLYPGKPYSSPDKKHFRLDSRWFVSDFFEYEDDMPDQGQYEDDEREEQCKYRDFFEDTKVIVYADTDADGFELPIVIQFTWEELHMMNQNYALNHFKRINLSELR